MVAEFEANLRIVESDLAANDTAHARIASFTDQGELELQSMSSEDVTATIGGWLDWSGFDPETGSAQALALADQEWTEPERREVQVLLRSLGQLQSIVMENQRRLESAAREILAYLRK